MDASPKIVLAKLKPVTLFKFKFVNNVRVSQVYRQLKNRHQLQRPKTRPKAKVSHVKRKRQHHRAVEDVMRQHHHQIQNNNCSSSLSSLIVLFQWVVKLKFPFMSKDPIHKHVGTKVKNCVPKIIRVLFFRF